MLLPIRNAISFGVMNQYVVLNLQPSLILNSDAMQYTVGCDISEKIEVKYIKNKSDPCQFDDKQEILKALNRQELHHSL